LQTCRHSSADRNSSPQRIIFPHQIQSILIELKIVPVTKYDTDIYFTGFDLSGFPFRLIKRFIRISTPETSVGIIITDHITYSIIIDCSQQVISAFGIPHNDRSGVVLTRNTNIPDNLLFIFLSVIQPESKSSGCSSIIIQSPRSSAPIIS